MLSNIPKPCEAASAASACIAERIDLFRPTLDVAVPAQPKGAAPPEEAQQGAARCGGNPHSDPCQDACEDGGALVETPSVEELLGREAAQPERVFIRRSVRGAQIDVRRFRASARVGQRIRKVDVDVASTQSVARGEELVDEPP
jgi:hypothetical protein